LKVPSPIRSASIITQYTSEWGLGWKGNGREGNGKKGNGRMGNQNEVGKKGNGKLGNLPAVA